MHGLGVAASILVCFLAGCATTCKDEDIYRPTVLSAGHGTMNVQQTFVMTDIASLSTVNIGECGWGKRNAKADPVALCLTIRVEDAHFLQVPTPVVRVTSSAGVDHELPVGRLGYSIFTLYQADGSERPDSTLKSPTVAPLEVRRGHRFGNGRTDVYSFDASAPFQGASSTFGPPLALSQHERRRQYHATLLLPPDLGKQFVVALPSVLLDDKPYALPRLEFRHSRESVCSSRA